MLRRSLMKAAANEYRAKAFEWLSLAECMNDPERRAEILRYARWWTQLTEPVGPSRSAGGLPDIREPMPPKPKWTRRRTYHRSRNEIQTPQSQIDETPT